jgi:hypothetical protein
MVRRLFRLILILALPVAMFAPTTASAANAPAVSIHIVNQGELVSGGVVVTVDYSCLFGDGVVGAQVSQDPTFTGTGDALATCDDQKHQVSLFVAGAFTAGSASALAFISSSAGNANTGFVEIQIK